MKETQYRHTLAKAKVADVVRVTWRDSSRVMLGWADLDDYMDAAKEQRELLEETAGYFIGSNDAYVVIALSYSPKSVTGMHDGTKALASDAMMIPHEAVRSFETIWRR